MTGNAKVHHGLRPEDLTRLKPQKLGRHYHLVPAYIEELSSKHPRIISDYFLSNYRINLELEKVAVHEERQQPAECVYHTPLGEVGFAIDRELLTEALECYYGGTYLANQEAPPISTSEQRMRSRLGMDVTDLFARSLLEGESFGKLTTYENAYKESLWEYVAEFRYKSHVTGIESSIFIYLDAQLVDELTNRLASPAKHQFTGGTDSQIKHLPVHLNCILAATQMPLQQVLELKPGNILTVRLFERCDVAINHHKLFRGTVFEDDGSLFLTSLESIKTS